MYPRSPLSLTLLGAKAIAVRLHQEGRSGTLAAAQQAVDQLVSSGQVLATLRPELLEALEMVQYVAICQKDLAYFDESARLFYRWMVDNRIRMASPDAAVVDEARAEADEILPIMQAEWVMLQEALGRARELVREGWWVRETLR